MDTLSVVDDRLLYLQSSLPDQVVPDEDEPDPNMGQNLTYHFGTLIQVLSRTFCLFACLGTDGEQDWGGTLDCIGWTFYTLFICGMSVKEKYRSAVIYGFQIVPNMTCVLNLDITCQLPFDPSLPLPLRMPV